MLFIVQFYIFELDLAFFLLLKTMPWNKTHPPPSHATHGQSDQWQGGTEMIWFGHSWASHGNLVQEILGTQDILGWFDVRKKTRKGNLVIPCWFTTTVVLWLFWAGRGYVSNYQVIWSAPKGNHTRKIHKVWTCAYFPAVFWSELILIVMLIHFVVLSFLRWDIYIHWNGMKWTCPIHFPAISPKSSAVGAGSSALRGQRRGAPGEGGPRAAPHTAALEAMAGDVGKSWGKRWVISWGYWAILG